jgi:cell division protein FtsA
MARYGHGRLIGALDIGSSKIVCLVGEIHPNGRDAEIHVAGLGHQRSRGMKGGVVSDPAALETAIRSAVAAAERDSGVTLEEVYVAITCGRLASRTVLAHAAIAKYGVTSADIDRVVSGARAYSERDGRLLVHLNRRRFLLDGIDVGDNPRGMAAVRLSAELHAVTADVGAVQNLLQVVERCHLTVAGFVAAPYASALSVTTADERRLGVSVVDLGGGTSSWAVFTGGEVSAIGVLPTGGHHLTFEIAQNLHARVAEAERIKTLYASMVNARSDVCDRISYVRAGETESAHEATRAHVSAIVRARMEMVLDALRTKLDEAGAGPGTVVLTGGASQLVGLAEAAARCLGRPVRLGRPRLVAGLSAGVDQPAFAAGIGLGLAVGGREVDTLASREGCEPGYLGRVGRWIGSGFKPG